LRQLFKDVSRLKDVICEENRPLAPMTTMKVGGDARLFVRPLSLSGLEGLLALLHGVQVPYRVLGNGSNLIVDDGGVDLVISLCSLRDMQLEQQGSLYVEAGCTLSSILGFCIENGLEGLEPLTGIPGSLGGALFMNAGANGVSLGDFVDEICVTTGQGSTWLKVSHDFFSYRSSNTPEGALISAARLKVNVDSHDEWTTGVPSDGSCLKRATPRKVHERIKRIMRKRLSSQPLGRPSAGCVFKNPSVDCLAWRLIVECGLQGFKMNRAQVSPKHANFIVNLGDAKASDVIGLIDFVKERVWEQTGVMLKEEVVIWENETEH